MMSKLYVVGTPIGNLSDMTPRAVEILGSVDFIAAEDTRVTLKLLTHFDIHKPLVSYYEHNLREKGEEIINRILAGETCAIVTDAGMPCISDPGEDLVKLCADHGIEVNVIPSPTAAMSALAISGLSTSRFSFEGFLSVTKKQRYAHLEEVKELKHTLIFYEAPHKLKRTLNDLLAVLGDRRISLCRELTKIHEEVLRGRISEMISYYENTVPKGEFVIVVEGNLKIPEERYVTEEAVEYARKLIVEGQKVSDACKEAAKKYGFTKSEIYSGVISENRK
ncbi:MAG: 16S rRNA (cytidine(1402)-2'-O)-methyltransferase [Ruminiclostridium sp.]|nr:16S rRNA (cytidine(1402)-2'-O)-methyltransferase [Ruminiclostridium sp.]